VRAIVAAGAGSTIDIIPRIVFEQLTRQLGQPIVVENRPGAGGTIAASSVAKADPDGYTVLVHSSAHTIAPSLYPSLSYHPARDFAGIISLGILPQVMVVSPAKGWKTVGELVAAAKARPGALNFSSVGLGTATHLAAERFRLSAGVDAVHIPFKSGAEAMTEVIAGRVDFFFGPVGLVLPHVNEGKLLALVVNSAKRATALADVPTTSEAGLRDAEYPFWFGVFAPAKTSTAVVEKVHAEAVKALQTPAVRDKMIALGVEPTPMRPHEFDAHIEKEIVTNAALVEAVGVRTK
jgi:tripartite-type tricarboxylate transporter receptor subunit TctC